MSLDEQIRAIVCEAVTEAAEKASRSKECMNAQEARVFLGLTPDQWKKRRHLIPCREESERSRYYLRDDLLEYLKSLPRRGFLESDYPLDYAGHRAAPQGTSDEDPPRNGAPKRRRASS